MWLAGRGGAPATPAVPGVHPPVLALGCAIAGPFLCPCTVVPPCLPCRDFCGYIRLHRLQLRRPGLAQLFPLWTKDSSPVGWTFRVTGAPETCRQAHTELPATPACPHPGGPCTHQPLLVNSLSIALDQPTAVTCMPWPPALSCHHLHMQDENWPGADPMRKSSWKPGQGQGADVMPHTPGRHEGGWTHGQR